MKKLVPFALFIFLTIPAFCGKIVYGEYYFNNDPGFGKGISISLPSIDSVLLFNFEIPVSKDLPEGYNTVFFRFRDDKNKWSMNYSRSFFKINPKNKDIKYMEYYIDVDPGFGKATPVNFSTSEIVNLDLDIPISGLTPGFHKIGMRALSMEGKWGHKAVRGFYIDNKKNKVNITALKYYFVGYKFISDTFYFKPVTPSPTIDLEFDADMAQLPTGLEYQMHVVAINENGVSGPVYTETLKKCGKVPKASFDIIVTDKKVSFVNKSQNCLKYKWIYDDGTTDTLSNPTHVYKDFNLYKSRLIAGDDCWTDTFDLPINVVGLKDISVKTGGNSGDVSMFAYGSFSNDVNIKLVSLNNIIQADSLTLIRTGLAGIRFNLRKAVPGDYMVICSQGVRVDTLKSLFKVFNDTMGALPYIKVNNPPIIRAGRERSIDIKYGNNGYIDAHMVPLFIIMEGDSNAITGYSFTALTSGSNQSLETINPVFKPDSLYGKPFNGAIFAIFIPHIAARSSNSFSIRINTTKNLKFTYWIGSSLYNSPLDRDGYECLATMFKYGGKEILKLADSMNPFLSCGSAIVDNGLQMGVDYTNPDYSATQKFGWIAFSMAKIMLDCTTDFIPVTKAGKVAYTGLKSLIEIHKGYKIVMGGASCVKSFYNRLTPPEESEMEARTSFDPNEKVGPVGRTEKRYIKSSKMLDYTIFFENKDTAKADAQEIVITDTLDLALYDIQSLFLGKIYLGDTLTINPPTGVKEFSTDIDLRPGKNLIVRVNSKLDTITGLLYWRFLSLDPVTMELTSDPLIGLLPPNKKPVEGEGSVSYSISLKKNLASGTTVKNKATIVFDTNPPIVTNEYLNTVDDIPPVSKMVGLPASTKDTSIRLNWEGSDSHGGILAFNIYVSVNGKPFKPLLFNVSGNSADFVGSVDSTYSFYSIGVDNAGNNEPGKHAAEATIQISKPTQIRNFTKSNFEIFPNPASCCFTLRLNSAPKHTVKVAVFNSTGQQVYWGEFSGQEKEFDLSSLPKGIYTVKILSGSDVGFQKVLLQ